MEKSQPVDHSLEVERWRAKKLLKYLQGARGNGTSMISLILPPKDQISRASKMLTDEYGTASNIKSRVNRLSVLGAITSAQQRLKLFAKTPQNGLAIYTGTVIGDDGKEKKVCIDIEPVKPINTSLYLCDSRFHVEELLALMEDDYRFGFIVMDGHGALFAFLSGNSKEIAQTIPVDLPKKHGRGGQSSVRFARLRLEKRHNYVRKVAEAAAQIFITGNKVNVTGIIFAGSADFKNELLASDILDQRIREKVLKLVDVGYGGENGLNQAIELSEEVLQNIKLVSEKRVIRGFFEEIAMDTGKACYGVNDTMSCMELGSLETLIVYEGLALRRSVAEDGQVTYSEEGDGELLTDWVSENYKSLNCRVEFVSDRSQEGAQFVSGFGGVGGILRYKMDMCLEHEEVEDFSDADIF